MSRLPVRLRLTLAFALAMAVVLAAIGAVLYLRLESSLNESIDEGLRVRLADASALVARGEPPPPDSEESFARVLEPGSTVTEPEGTRVLSTTAGGRVVVVGTSLEDRDEALSGLVVQLLVVGPAALVLASLLGYGIAAASLRPVESMRAEAAAISEPGRRLPVPAARDELARLAETLNAMLERLERALERERSFTADASHELRTPLARLQAELELALRRPRSAEELERALRSAAAETERLARLAEDLLVLARSDRDGLPLRRAPVPAREVVERFADAVEVEVPEGLTITADRLRLEQALGALVANALDHGRPPIRLTALERDGRVEFHVSDEGPGFPPGLLPRAFERFSRADEARTAGGAGLGLAIAEAIARAHGGSAHAANLPGGGADVWLSIPRS
jgi:two-component system OmpR family sensor kinase